MITERRDGFCTMKASEFKARCLALMDEIAMSGEEIIITKRGKPVARLAPCERTPRTLFGAGGEIAMHDDLLTAPSPPARGPCATFPATPATASSSPRPSKATASSSPRPSKATGLSPPTPACSTGPVR